MSQDDGSKGGKGKKKVELEINVKLNLQGLLVDQM